MMGLQRVKNVLRQV